MSTGDPQSCLRAFFEELAPFEPGEWDRIRPLAVTRRLCAGEVWLHAGEAPAKVAFVVQGLLRKFYLDVQGREFTRGFARRGELAGPYAAILQEVASPMSIEALEASQVLELDVGEIRRAQAKHAGERRARIVAERALIERERREAWLLTCSPAERYGAVMRAMPWLEGRVAQRHIASYLGINPVSLSRIRGRLRRVEP